MESFTNLEDLSLIDTYSPDMTFSKFYGIYYDDMRGRLKESTLFYKSEIVRLKIMPYFGKLHMNQINANHIRKWQSIFLCQGYSNTYLKTINIQLCAIMNYAERFYDLPNPCSKAGSMGKTAAKEMKFWTLDEFHLFISAYQNDLEAYTAFEILYWTGMREGELLALTAADIHTKQSEIAITKTYQRIQMKDIISTPKTEKSKRKIPIPKFLLQEILFYIHSKNIKTNQRLFSHTKDYLYYKMKRGCSKTGVRKIRIHDIRHSHVCRSLGYF